MKSTKSTQSTRRERRAAYDAIEALGRLSRLLERRRQQLARQAGLSDAQWRALERIGRDDFLPSLFARDSDTSPAAVSRTLRQLLEKGLVAVSIAADDARRRNYRLTSRGRRVLETLHAGREQALGAVWDAFPAGEVDAFASFAGALADRLEAYAEQIEGQPRRRRSGG